MSLRPSPVDALFGRPSLLFALLCGGTLASVVSSRWPTVVISSAVLFLVALWLTTGVMEMPSRLGFLLAGVPLVLCFFHVASGQSASRFESMVAGISWLTAAVLVGAGSHLARSGHTITFLRWWLRFGLLLGLLCITQLLTGTGHFFWLLPSGFPDIYGPFAYKNSYATWVALLFPVAAWLVMTRRVPAGSGIAALLVCWCSLQLCNSRAGLGLVVLEAVGLLIWGVRAGYLRPRMAGLLLAGFIALGTIAALSTPNSAWSRITLELGDQYRLALNRSSWDMLQDAPWAGSGLGTYALVYPAYAYFDAGRWVNFAHNDWLEWGATGGIPFLGFLLLQMAALLRLLPRYPWGLGLAAVALQACVDYPFQRLAVSAWWFVLAGLVIGSAPELPSGQTSPRGLATRSTMLLPQDASGSGTVPIPSLSR